MDQYINSFLQFADPSGKELWLQRYAKNQYKRIDRDARFITNKVSPRRIVNIGAAPFLLEYLLREKYGCKADLISLDLAPDRFPELVAGVNLNITKIDVENCTDSELVTVFKEADLIVFCEVFEHLRINLLKTLRRISNSMERDAKFYMTTPNGLGVRQLIRLLRGYTGPSPVKNWKQLEDIGHMGHIREYSMREVVEVLNETGFVDIEITTVKHWQSIFENNVEHTVIRILETLWVKGRWNIRVIASVSEDPSSIKFFRR